ncbi:taste receptor type 1 member 1-like [Mugil cephalus]|uniref:taste receptor type 1 member 1-like n=1 Tax=Mugil cephalus TaxID=48193 RepID=UPI001FB6F5F6|nr:taste receptor type 1 member 1-like [Mugil cephalus]
MERVLAVWCLLGTCLGSLTQCTIPTSEFRLEGDYLIGGLFDIHLFRDQHYRVKPEAIECSDKKIIESSYRRFQMMRFSVAQINNSTDLLPGVSLGYELFDHCSDTENFPNILNLISFNGLIQPWSEQTRNLSKVIAVVGIYTSTATLTAAPLFMTDLIPMVSYGASSSVFSRKQIFPSFLRTVHPNKDVIEVILSILKHFDWRWVSFLYSDDDYGKDGLELFIRKINDTNICLAYSKGLNTDTNYYPILKQIEAQRIPVIIVFTAEWIAEALIGSAIKQNITNKVWVAGDAWSLNKKLPKEKGIRNIGTVLGVSEPTMTIPGFSDFIYATKTEAHCENVEEDKPCNQICNCSSQTAEKILAADPSFNFPVYSAVYAVAHALHNVMQCGGGRCNTNITVHPHMVLAEMKKSNFTLLNHSIRFDENGDPIFGSYSIVFWNDSGDAHKVGFYDFPPSFRFSINDSSIKWFSGGNVPTSRCSKECEVGYKKKQDGIHKCCFTCHNCPSGTYINSTADPYTCSECKETEWSEDGSTSCSLRVVDYIPYTDGGAIVIMVNTGVLVGLTVAVAVLFAINYNTPVVRSAGGPMCFLILGCLSLCSLSVFFYFGTPTVASCILRYLPFLLFYTVCLACFVVRSFQIVVIFKITAAIPKLQTWWTKYYGQWLIITAAFVIQALLLLIGHLSAPPKPYNDTKIYQDRIILNCEMSPKAFSGAVALLTFLCSLCFIFSYMAKDLPKNYNEAKAITFCLLLLILTWIVFATVYILYSGKYIQIINTLAVLSSVYSFLFWYFLPKCYIIIFQPHKNTQQYFQSLIQNYTKTICQ